MDVELDDELEVIDDEPQVRDEPLPLPRQTRESHETMEPVDAVLTSPRDAASAEDISQHLQTFLAGEHVAGAVVAVVEGDYITHLGVTGVANVETGEAMEDTDTFLIGSVTKSMTATVLGDMVDDGLLSWTDTVGSILMAPGHPGYAGVEFGNDRDQATVTALLAHYGGYPKSSVLSVYDWQNPAPESGFDHRWGFIMDRIYFADIDADGEIDPLAMSDYEYTNIGYAVAGALIEKTNSTTFEWNIAQRLFSPLGMTQCNVIDALNPPTARGHQWSGEVMGAGQNVTYGLRDPYPHFYDPAKNVVCDVHGLAKYAAYHMRDEREPLQTLHAAPFGLDYAFGWTHLDGEARTEWADYLSHSGANGPEKFTSKFRVVPDRDHAYIVLTNQHGSTHPDEDVDDFGTGEIMTWLMDEYPVETGCVGKAQVFVPDVMYGCAASVVSAPFVRDLMCADGYHVCSHEEYVANNVSIFDGPLVVPDHHYWLSTNLQYGGQGSGSCMAVQSGGTPCRQGEPMRVCAPQVDDPMGNQCNWHSCGTVVSQLYYPQAYLGGCNYNDTAGVMCCAD
ncbi:MAG: serine hydrolase domain-containing protein [Myxococcota bacterium]